MSSYLTLCMEVVPVADAMRKIAAFSTPISTRSGNLYLSHQSDPLITDRVPPFCRSSSWTREELESLLRAWTNAALFDKAADPFGGGIGVRAWKRTRPGIW